MGDQNTERAEPATRYIPVADWPKHYPWPTVPGLRTLIHRCKKTGFDSVIKRANGRVLIDEAAFHRWVAAQNGGAA